MTDPDDPIAFELFRNAIFAIADEMALTIFRTTYSGVLKDNMDYSTAFCDADGKLVAQGLTLPGHLGAIPTALDVVVRRYGDSMVPGDIFALNDPFEGGMHLPDIFVFKPLYFNGERIAFAATICHHTDVGGRVAGSNASDSTEIYQEGLRIPPLRLYAAGAPNETLFALIEKNVRVPVKVFGDLRAQLAACHIAERQFQELARRSYGAHQIASANMMRAIRAVSVERGRDPRGYTLCAFGGNGPVFACTLASALGMRRVLIPPAPGLFSAFGLLYADVEHHFSRTVRRLLRGADLALLNSAWDDLAAEAGGQLAAEGFVGDQVAIRRRRACTARARPSISPCPLPDGAIDAAMVARIEEAFGQEHERTYGHRAGQDEPVELTEIRLSARGLSERNAGLGASVVDAPEGGAPLVRAAYFGPQAGWLDTPVLSRADLASPREGPCIVEEYDATCVIAPGATARLDPRGCILIEL